MSNMQEVSKLTDELQSISNEMDRLAEFLLMNFPEIAEGNMGSKKEIVDVAIDLLKEHFTETIIISTETNELIASIGWDDGILKDGYSAMIAKEGDRINLEESD